MTDSAGMLAILRAVANLNSGIDSATLPDRLLSAISTVVECDQVSFSEIPTSIMKVRSRPIGNLDIVYEGNNFPLLKDSHNTDGCFVESALFGSLSDKLGISYQLGIGIPVERSCSVVISLTRNSGPFNSAERNLLAALVPHISNALRSSFDFQSVVDRSALLSDLLSKVSRGFARVRVDGELIEVSKQAERTFEKHFVGWSVVTGQLPDPIRDWMENAFTGLGYCIPQAALRIKKNETELRVSPLFDHSIGIITLLLEERARISSSHLGAAGLTIREVEILQMLESGKSDSVIGLLLSISSRTVQKHIENIFKKLGVETRSAAIHKAMEIVRLASADNRLIPNNYPN